MNPLFDTIISVVFIFLGTLVAFTMMAIKGKQELPKPYLYIKIYRYTGWLFFSLTFLW